MKTIFRVCAVYLALMSLAGVVRAQGTAFSYQGRLINNGVPANGAHDFIFTVHDAAVDGNALGDPATLADVAVSAGQFVVSLDFGADVFTGAARWIEISVRVTGVEDYTLLTPRQAVLSNPYAIYAARAGAVANGTVAADQLNTDGVAPTAGQFLSYDGGKLVWNDPGVAAGNIFSLNGTTAYYTVGSVGLGTDSPEPGIRLQVDGPTRVAAGGNGGFLQIGTPNGETGLSVSGSNRFDLRFNGSTVKLTAGLGLGPPSSESGIAVDTLGNVGIGTSTPTPGLRLEVNGPTRVTPGGSGGFLQIGTPNGETGLGVIGNNRFDLRFDGLAVSLVAGLGIGAPPAVNGIAITTAGNVGVGTINPIASARLHAESGSFPFALFGSATGSGVGVYGVAAPGGTAVQGFGAGSATGVKGQSDFGYAIFAAGNAGQERDKGGFVKAMALVRIERTGAFPVVSVASIRRCFNGVVNSTTGNCFFTVVGADRTTATIDFGFPVNDRFVSVTALGQNSASVFAFPTPNSVQVMCGFDNTTEFFIFVF